MESTSNTVLLRMIEFLQNEVGQSSRRILQLESVNEAQARVIRTMRDDLAESQDRVHHLIQGSEIVLRGLDEIYNYTRGMFEAGRLDINDWDVIYRSMLRADIGFAVLNGAPLVDLTTQEEVDGAETETDDEVEL